MKEHGKTVGFVEDEEVGVGVGAIAIETLQPNVFRLPSAEEQPDLRAVCVGLLIFVVAF